MLSCDLSIISDSLTVISKGLRQISFLQILNLTLGLNLILSEDPWWAASQVLTTFIRSLTSCCSWACWGLRAPGREGKLLEHLLPLMATALIHHASQEERAYLTNLPWDMLFTSVGVCLFFWIWVCLRETGWKGSERAATKLLWFYGSWDTPTYQSRCSPRGGPPDQ